MPARLNDPVFRHRTVQLLVDAALVGLAYFLAYLLRFDQGIPSRYRELLTDTIAFVIVGKVAIFAAFGLYQKWWRYVGLRDFETILKAVVTASFVLVSVLFVWSPDRQRPAPLDRGHGPVADRCADRWGTAGGAQRGRAPARGSVLAKGREVLIVGAGEAASWSRARCSAAPSCARRRSASSTTIRASAGMRIHGLKVLGTTAELARAARRRRARRGDHRDPLRARRRCARRSCARAASATSRCARCRACSS